MLDHNDYIDEWDRPVDIRVKTEPHPKWDEFNSKHAMRCDQCKENAGKLVIMASDSIYHKSSFCMQCIDRALEKLVGGTFLYKD